ncbi:MAG: DUF4384 domain-containing protein [Limnobacter sp.]|nr:DUF4384 domain-containing protein [Limnobacter sp.]
MVGTAHRAPTNCHCAKPARCAKHAPEPADEPGNTANYPFVGETVTAQAAASRLVVSSDIPQLRIGKDPLLLRIFPGQSGYLSIFLRSSDGSLLRLLPTAGNQPTTIPGDTETVWPPVDSPMVSAGPAGEKRLSGSSEHPAADPAR